MSALTDAITVLEDAVQVGLLQGDGTVAGISTANAADITAAVAAVQVIAAPLIAGTDAAIASQALDVSARASIIGTVIASPGQGQRRIVTVNPNLFALATKYLGDAARWDEIARASGITDPQPTGIFTLLVPAP